MAVVGTLLVNLKAQTAVFDKKMRASTKSINHFRRATSLARTALGTLGIGLGLGALVGGIKQLASLAMEQEKAEQALQAALAATGQGFGDHEAAMKSLAAEVQRNTIYGDEFVLGLMTQATNLGVTAGNMKQTTQDAIGLATALNMDLNTALRYSILATQGEFTMLQRYIPALRKTTDVTKKLAIVQKLAAGGWEQARVQIKTTAGSLAQVKNELGDVGEKLGAGFLPLWRELAGLATQFGREAIKQWTAVGLLAPAPAEAGAGREIKRPEPKFHPAIESALAKVRDLNLAIAKGEDAQAAAIIKQQAGYAALEPTIGKVTGRLIDQLRAAQMTAEEWERTKLALAGASSAQLGYLDALRAKLAEVQAAKERGAQWEQIQYSMFQKRAADAKRIADFAGQVRESLKTPVESFKEFRDQLEGAVKAGMLGKAEMIAALSKRYDELRTDTEVRQRMDPGEFRVLKSSLLDIRGLGGMGMRDPALQKQERQLQEAIKTNLALEAIKNAGGMN